MLPEAQAIQKSEEKRPNPVFEIAYRWKPETHLRRGRLMHYSSNNPITLIKVRNRNERSAEYS